MAKAKTISEPVPAAGVRIQTKGPLGPSSPEVTIHASLEGGLLAGTPAGYSTRMRAASILVTDDPTIAARIPARTVMTVGEKGARATMLQAHFDARRMDPDERTIVVAGSAALIDAALDDSFRVVLACAADEEPPVSIAHWKTSRTKGSDVTTLSRD